MPESVVSKAKLCPASIHSSIASNIRRPALKDADSGLNGAKPAAIKSALRNLSVWASAGKNSRANVVLPAPLGPAMMMIFFNFQICFKRFYGLLCDLQTKPAMPKKSCVAREIRVLCLAKKDLLDWASIQSSHLSIRSFGTCAHDLMMAITISV